MTSESNEPQSLPPDEETQPVQPTTPTPQPQPQPQPAQPAQEPDPNTPPGPVNPDTDTEQQPTIENNAELEKMQMEMEKYQRAYREEMEQAAKLESNKEETFNTTIEYFRKNAYMAAATVVHLMQFSTSDSTRLGASKYLIECVRRGVVDDVSDPVNAIIQSLRSDSGPKELTPSKLSD